MDRALSERADCLIVAGDLFDSNSPPASAVRFVLKELDRLAAASETETIILPGSHDFLSLGSVYTSYEREFRRIPRTHVLGLDGRSCIVLKRSGVAVHGNPPRSNRSTERQFSRLRPSGDARWNVAVGHGSVDTVPGPPDDHPIAASELSSLDWSYVALGHWHSWYEVEGTTALALYPGSPEIVASDQAGAGSVALVVLDESGAHASKVRVGQRAVLEASVDVSGAEDALSVAERVRRAAPPDPDGILRLDLYGMLDLRSAFEEGELLEELSSDYFHVSQRRREFHVGIDDAELSGLSERLVIGRYARVMQERLAATSTDAEKAEMEDALKLGIALLQGKDVLA